MYIVQCTCFEQGVMLWMGLLLCISDIKPGVQCTYSVQGGMLGWECYSVFATSDQVYNVHTLCKEVCWGVGVSLCISDIGPGVQCTHMLCGGDMLGLGVSLCISDIKPGVQCTIVHALCRGGMLGVGELLCISDIKPGIQ